MQKTDLIKNNELFAGLDENALETLAASALTRKVAVKCLLFIEGDVANTMYLIKSGKVDVSVYNPDVDKEMILSTLQAGDHFGELSLFDGKPRSATVKTRTACEFVILNQAPVFHLIAQNPAFATNVIAYLCQKIRFITEIAQDLAVLDAYHRLRKLLYRLAKLNENGVLQTKLSLDQTEIASRLGCSREMINKTLGELTRGGYITYHKDTITIHKKLPGAR